MKIKKVLITAKNSYIGNSFASWVASSSLYDIEFITCRTDEWKNRSFSCYDVVLHVAGIAHVNASLDKESMYYRVNRDLSIALAKKAKQDGVKQFIFLSSMIVFGESNKTNPHLIVNHRTVPCPSGFYGNSKLEAEKGISALQDDAFNVVIIRPPMVYGNTEKGNFYKLVKVAQRTFVFPKINNKRSMIYIDNLCELIKLLIDNDECGIFHPQNDEYVNTSELVRLIGDTFGRNIVITSIFNPFVKILGRYMNSVNKVFGTFIYEQTLSNYRQNYNLVSLEESIKLVGRKVK